MLLGLGAKKQWERLSLEASDPWGSWGPKSLMVRPDLWPHSLNAGRMTVFTGLEAKPMLHRGGRSSFSMWRQPRWDTYVVPRGVGGVAGACLHRAASSRQHLVFSPEQIDAKCRDHSAAPRQREARHSRIRVAEVFFSNVTFLNSLWEKELGTLCSRTP